jgi:NADH-quinone oxidoreductase subunit N
MNALLVICGLGFVSLLAEIVNLKKGLTAFLIIGLIVAGVLVVMDWDTSLHYYSDMLIFNNFAIAFSALITVISVFWFWMAKDFFKTEAHQTDRSVLVVFAIAGGIIMVSFSNMAMLFLGIEILSISLYVLAGSSKNKLSSNEAALKYFIMGSFATGFLLMGIALIYGATSSFNIITIAEHISSTAVLPGFLYGGVALVLIGIAFKISAVPFHFWAPDVYSGSPTSITAFMSTVVKIAAIGAFYRLFSFCFLPVQSSWLMTLQVITVLTLIVANVTAVYQENVKRILAYSSVGHVGYILLAFVSNSATSEGTIFYYLVSYSITSIAAFTVLSLVETSTANTSLQSFNGLYKRNPFLAVVMTIIVLSLAGIPPLAGFFAKYMVFNEALDHGYTGLVVIAVVTSLVGVYFYFKVFGAMFFKGAEEGAVEAPFPAKLLLVILTSLTLLVGIFPDLLISLFEIR